MEIAYKYLMLSFTKLPISMLSKKSIPASPVLSLHTWKMFYMEKLSWKQKNDKEKSNLISKDLITIREINASFPYGEVFNWHATYFIFEGIYHYQ